MPLQSAHAVHMQWRDLSGLIAPLGSNIGQDGGNLFVLQRQEKRWHAKGSWVAKGGRWVASIQNTLNQVGGVLQEHGAVAAQCRIGALDALPICAVALFALVFVNAAAHA